MRSSVLKRSSDVLSLSLHFWEREHHHSEWTVSCWGWCCHALWVSCFLFYFVVLSSFHVMIFISCPCTFPAFFYVFICVPSVSHPLCIQVTVLPSLRVRLSVLSCSLVQSCYSRGKTRGEPKCIRNQERVRRVRREEDR